MHLTIILSGLLALSSGASAIWCNTGSEIFGADCATGLTQRCCSISGGPGKTEWMDDCSGGPPCEGGCKKNSVE
ncbi:hypothetical protein BUE80_DR002497 [Diplocarpon rosae]|nr:hypothetical protein BUE80_DR002497 [Diplocarpon rosae]